MKEKLKSFLNYNLRLKAIILALSGILGFSISNYAQEIDLPEFSMSKGMCYGSCPEYTLEIYKSKYMLFKGLKNTNRLGTYKKELTISEYKTICKAFKKSKFSSYLDFYESRVPDLPSVSITYHKKNKTITGKLERPQTILELEDLLSQYAENKDSWVLFEKPKGSAEELQKEGSMEIIIHVSNELDVASWIKRYHQYKMQLVKKIAPNLSYYLINFDVSKISADQMLLTLKKDPEVKGAQFNAEIKPRN
jgi:hypothetical protein